MPALPPPRLHFWFLAAAVAAASLPALAQTAAPAAPASAASAASAPRRAAAPPGDVLSQRVEVTGGRESDTDARRQSTASKIVIGREEIDKFGDATVGEVLRRLPGVTTPGAPGRGGPPRMRGLGNGYTQLLIDGQRVPPGFSLESLTPEQIERIEILRAPTAETGARAIAGTINIITREGFKRRINDFRIGTGFENGRATPGLFWTRNDSIDEFTYNLSLGAFFPRRESSNDSHTTVTDVASGAVLEDRDQQSSTSEKRKGLNLTARLQWRLSEAGDVLLLTPTLFHTEAETSSRYTLTQAVSRPGTPGLFDHAQSDGDNRFSNFRLNGQWRQRLGPMRLEVSGNGGAYRSMSNSLRQEFDSGNGVLRTVEDHSRSRERSYNLSAKGTGLAGGNAEGGEHGLVGGIETEGVQRNDTRQTLQNGSNPLQGDFGDDLQASSLRLAAYLQDEWNISPNWGLNAGLRWEGITTRGDLGDGTRPENRSSVATPLLHAVWKPDPKKRDQVRMSLTRSYRSPPLGNLIARPSLSRDYPASGTNTVTAPDNAGNPTLKPELAWGQELAFERYLEGGGLLSVNLFRRSIQDLIRSETRLETVSWSPVPRYVRRPQNVGDAVTHGIELEAKFRLDQAFEGGLPVELKANLALFNSRVKSVPGPDNRLDQQAKGTANFGADYRLRSLPLTLGGNANFVPGYTTRLDVGNTATVSTKAQWDAYALWTFSPAAALRVLANNFAPRDYSNITAVDAVNPANGRNERTTLNSTGPSYVNWQVRLELKL